MARTSFPAAWHDAIQRESAQHQMIDVSMFFGYRVLQHGGVFDATGLHEANLGQRLVHRTCTQCGAPGEPERCTYCLTPSA